MPSISVANFNLHAGVDGWGRAFDYVGAAAAIDADVLALEEVFVPNDGKSQAREIADSLGYHVIEMPLGRLTVLDAGPELADKPGWGPRPMIRGIFSAVVAEKSSSLFAPSAIARRRRGNIAIALLSRVGEARHHILDLPKLPRDKITRRAIVAEFGELGLRVMSTHLGHLSHGSPLQMLALRHEVGGDEIPTVVIGDMNCWGVPIEVFTGLSRAVIGRSWPAWSPHSQIDHILTNARVSAHDGRVLEDMGSDHRPIRASLHW